MDLHRFSFSAQAPLEEGLLMNLLFKALHGLEPKFTATVENDRRKNSWNTTQESVAIVRKFRRN